MINNPAISKHVSAAMYALCIALTVLIIGLLVWVTIYLVSMGGGSLSLAFFTNLPEMVPPGMKHAIVGTFVLVGMASVIGIPVGIGVAIYLSEYEADSWLASPVRFMCDVLTGVPSIVVGILGYELLVVPFGSGEVLGFSVPFLQGFAGISKANAFAGALALAFIMIPIVARTTEEMLRLVPQSYREASIALGASKAKTIMQVVLPSATGSVVTGIMLAIARIAGETAPLLFTAASSRLLPLFRSESPYIQTDDLKYPFPSLTVQIYNYAKGPWPEEHKLAWSGVLVLIAIIFFINLAIRFLTRKAAKVG